MNKLKIETSGLTFDELTHTYRLNGAKIPSVSAIIRPMNETFYKDVDKEVLNKAADRGRAIHSAIETWICYQMNTIVDEDHRGYFDGFLEWYKARNVEPLATECMIYHKILKYAGTADLICTINNETFLVDFKNTVSVNEKAYSLQLEAYRQAFKTHGVEIAKKMILHLRPDGTYKEIILADDPYKWLAFNHFKGVWDYINS